MPTSRPRERRSSEQVARESAEVAGLRKQVHAALAGRRHDEAAELCKRILELEPSDAEAFTLLESYYRKRRDYASLRDLLLASTRATGLAVDVRKLRLREGELMAFVRGRAQALGMMLGQAETEPRTK